jgi:1,2-dihydroxy-3-keto-5-methylthiopentene dioxygenase
MATLSIPTERRTLRNLEEIAAYLHGLGIQYEVWTPEVELGANPTADSVLAAYSREIDRLKSQGGYVTADVIDVHPDTPGLDAMLAKFDREHTHDEDEVRFIIEGRGVFHIHPQTGPVVAIEVEPGDLIRVPRGTMHWFNLCPDRRIRAIRLFQDPSGWTPHYSQSGVDRNFEAVCFGASFIPSVTA